MIKLGVIEVKPPTLFIFSALVLMTGCRLNLHEKAPICAPPGAVAKAKCFYNLEITKIVAEGLVRAKVPLKVIEHNARHSAYTKLGGAIGFKVMDALYGDFEYEFRVDNSRDLKERQAYEFESIPDETTLKFIGDAKYPEKHEEKVPGYKHRQSKTGGTQLFARHEPQCCMCSTCETGCVCPGEGGCPWCGAADLKTLLVSVTSAKGTVDIRVVRGARQSDALSGDAAESVLALMIGSLTHGNISLKSIANYKYDQKFVPSCLARNA